MSWGSSVAQPLPEQQVQSISLRDMVVASGAKLVLCLIGDSSWQPFPRYDETCQQHCILPVHDDSALVVNISCPGMALRQKSRRMEKFIQEQLQHFDVDPVSLFIPIQVPFRGGTKSWQGENGRTREEDFVSGTGVVFTDPLSSLLQQGDWIDSNHFDRGAGEKLLRHACAIPSVRAKLQKNAREGGPVPIVCVLSDGWNRNFLAGDEDRSRYWKCRHDLGMCSSLKMFREWCDHYAGWRPASTECLPMLP